MFLVLEQRDNFLAVYDSVLRKTGIDVSENLFSASPFISFLICVIYNVFVLSAFFFLTGTDRNVMALQKERM